MTIEEIINEIDKLVWIIGAEPADGGLEHEEVVNVLKDFAKQILEALVDREREKIIGQNVIFNQVVRNKLKEAHGDNCYNQAKQDTISYLKSIIKTL